MTNERKGSMGSRVGASAVTARAVAFVGNKHIAPRLCGRHGFRENFPICKARIWNEAVCNAFKSSASPDKTLVYRTLKKKKNTATV